MGTPLRTAARLTAALLLSALVACAGADELPSQPTVLNVLLADDWASADAVVDAVASFEAANPGVRVGLTGVPFSHLIDNVRNAEATATPIDVVQWHAFAAAADGLAQPTSDLWAEHGVTREDFVPGAVEDVEWAGELYGMPLDTNALALYVNDEQLDAVGVEPADIATPADLERVAHLVTGSDRFGIALSASGWVTYGWIRAFGGEVVEVDEDGRPTFLLDSPETVAAFDLLGRLVADGVATQPYARNTQDDAVTIFGERIVAMHTSGSWDAPTLRESEEPFDFTVVPMPAAGPGSGTVLGGSSLFIPTISEQPELAFAFMRHLTSDETMLRLAREEGRLPSLRSQLRNAYFQEDPALAAVTRELERASVMKLIAYPEAHAAYTEAIEEVVAGRIDAADALAEAQRLARSSIGTATS